MSKRRLLGCLLLIMALITSLIPYNTAEASNSSADFVMDGNILTKYTGSSATVTIPDNVEAIGESAFENNLYVNKVIMPNSVKSIGEYAFWGCENLSSIELSSSLDTIDDYAFMNCTGLKTYTIPSNIENIGIKAFANCANLEKINIPYQVHFIHDSAFDGCYKLIINAAEGTYAYDYAKDFYERQKENPEYEDVNNLNSTIVEKPEETNPPISTPQPTEKPVQEDKNVYGQTSIVGNSAVVFMDSSALEVKKDLLDSYLENQPISSLDFSAYIDYDSNGLIKNSIPKVTIYNNILADQAFYKSNLQKNEKINEKVKVIGEFSYARTTMSSLYIPEGVEEIGYGAFYHCDYLSSVFLPTTIKKVSPNAFEKTFYMNSFMNSEDDFLINNNCLLKYNGNSDNVTIPEGIICIASEAFKNHDEINSIDLPESLKYINESVFEGCKNITNIIIPESIISINDRAFYGTKIKKVTLPNSIESIGYNAFNEDTEITSDASYKLTFEESSMRLSNSDLRTKEIESDVFSFEGIKENPEDNSVYVLGSEGYAVLSGAEKNYYLSLSSVNSNTIIDDAYNFIFNKPLENATYYNLTFSDSSKVPITRLGTRSLKVLVPAEPFENSYVQAFGYDANGQLTTLKTEKVTYKKNYYIKIQMNYVSDIALVPTGVYDGNTFTEYVSLESLGAKPDNSAISSENNILLYLKILFSCIFAFSGLWFLLGKRKVRG